MLIRRANERGHDSHGWLDTFHTFSFARYYDPNYTGYRSLVVLNEDRIRPGAGFPPHSHREMEILTYVISGTLAHRDSMGNGSLIYAGEFQRMSAGTGVTHSEYNASEKELLHLLQIWIEPDVFGIEPSYEQRNFRDSERTGQLRLIASPDSSAGSLLIHQDARIYSAILPAGETIEDRLEASRHLWVQVVRGALELNSQLLSAGDGVAMDDGGPIELKAPVEGGPAEILLFDLA